MDLFSLAAKLTLDSSGYDKGVIDAARSGKDLASSLENTFGKIKKFAAGAISVAAVKKGIDTVLDLVNATSDYGDKVDKQSQVLGLSRKAYQEWDYILGQNGASIDSMATSMKTLNSLILSAAEGSEESKDAFAELGLGIHEIETLNPEEQFEAVVRAFQKLPAGANKSALAVKIFGKNGMQLLPLLNQSSDSIDELRQRAQELGIIMSDDAVDASVAYNDAMDDMNRTFNALKYSIGAKLLPIFTTGVTKITNFAGKLVNAFNQDGLKGVFNTLGQGLGSFIERLKSSDSPVLQLLGDSLTVIKDTIEIIGKLFTDFDGTVAELKSSDSPVLPLIGNALSLIKTVFSWILDNKETVIAAVTGIVAVFAAGKIITFVASISPLTWIFSAIAAGIALVATNWDEIKGWIGKAWDTTVTWVQNKWEAVSTAFSTAKEWVGKKWKTVVSWAQEKWSVISDAFTAANEWVSEKAHEIKLAWKSTVDAWIGRIRGWLNGTGLSEIAVEFGATIADWFNTIQSWLDGTGLSSITLRFASVVSNFIKTIKDWAENGLDVVVRFLGSLVTQKTDSSYIAQEQGAIDFYDDLLMGSNAKGLNTVPYDNYVTRLHRGEQVLTASQARQRNDNGIDTAALAAAIAGAIREAMKNVTVNSYLNGRDVTDSVNRNTMREVKARRFAT